MDIFVYGSLTEPEQVGQVVDSFAFLGPAVLEGLHPVQGAYPTLAPGGETGGRLLRTDEIDALDSYEGVDESRRLSSASRKARPSCDVDESPCDSCANRNSPSSGDVDENQRFSPANQESPISDDVDDDLYVRVAVPLEGGDQDAETVALYVGDPTRLGVEEPVEWPGATEAEPFADRVERYLREHEVRVRRRRG